MLHFNPPKDLSLRPYQESCIDAIRGHIRNGKKKVICAAGTGAGKTVIASQILKWASEKKTYSVFIADRVSLIHQTSATFDSYGIPHGIVQGTAKRWMPYEDVQVCSAQTLANRFLPRQPNLIIIDEAHCQYKSTIEYINKNPQATVIGLSATPFTPGLCDTWDAVVDVITTRKLISQGYLIEPKMFIAKSPDDSEYTLNNRGEFKESSLSEAGIKIVGDIVEEWIKKTHDHFGGPAKTIVFSPTVEHGRELCAAFGAAGYNFQQISYLDKDEDERAAKIQEFREQDTLIDGLVSCTALTKGFDVADIKVAILAKAYRKSLSSVMQELGRVMRSSPGKDQAIVLDHCGNIERFGADIFDVWENGVGELPKASKQDSTPRETTPQTREKAKCPECSGAMRGITCICCGWERPARSDIVAVPGELEEFTAHNITAFAPRPGLRATCLSQPKVVWRAALNYCSQATSKGDDVARKWAYGIFRGIYPQSTLPPNWYTLDMPSNADGPALDLVKREVKRFRTKKKPTS